MGASPPHYHPAYGWRLDRVPGQRITAYETENGSLFHLPLVVLLNDRIRGEGGIWMSRAEAEQLHAELCYMLTEDPAAALDCQRSDATRTRS
ncbi:hypothetical protein ACF08W_28860 [Streptomyces sp. NPDC015144]|uniref:hypothetical protein n=1 Tax=Streptomyces sp. NPDC015144 TaxID=3364944 RepID=UPI0036F4C39D